MTISPASRNGRPRADWGSRNGDAPRPIPAAVRATQARASDPAASAFVSANAGSGKTHVLVQRVIRLLLDGVPPEKILCITFTKAAAANMAERVFTTLGHWVTLDDAALDAAIREAGHRATRRQLAHARARAVRLRAGDAGRAEGADHPRAVHPAAAAISVRGQRAGALYRARRPRPDRHDGARQPRVLLEASRDPDSATGRALDDRDGQRRRRHLQGRGARGLSAAAIISWPGPTRPAAPRPRRPSCRARSASTRRHDRGRRARDRRRAASAAHRWLAIADAALNAAANPTPNQAARLRAALQLTGTEQVDGYLGVFLTEDRAPRKSLLTKQFGDGNPALARVFDQEACASTR